MIYSGVDLIRTSGLQAEQLRRLSGSGTDEAATSVAVVETAAGSTTSQDNPQNALLRFAKFVKGETSKKKKRSLIGKPAASRLPDGYLKQIQMFAGENETSSPSLDVYI